jgi:large repetitive protein
MPGPAGQHRWLHRASAARPAAPQALRVSAQGPDQKISDHVTFATSPCILFLDSRTENLPAVIRDVAGKLRIVLLDRDADGISQIAHHLRERRAIDQLLISTSDERGRLSLGSSSLTVGNLYAHEDNLRRIGAAMSPQGRIRILGRNVQAESSDGPLLIMLSRLADAPVESCAAPAWAIPWPDIFQRREPPDENRLVA